MPLLLFEVNKVRNREKHRTVYPINWHNNNIKCRSDSIQVIQKNLEDLLAKFEHESAELAFYCLQVHEAEKKGKTEFDRDRFMASKKEQFIAAFNKGSK